MTNHFKSVFSPLKTFSNLKPSETKLNKVGKYLSYLIYKEIIPWFGVSFKYFRYISFSKFELSWIITWFGEKLIKTEICEIGQIFGCLCKQKLKLIVGSRTQLNLSSNIAAYLFGWHVSRKKYLLFAEVYICENFLCG